MVLLLLCDADFLRALGHMVLELDSSLALVTMWLQPEKIPSLEYLNFRFVAIK